MSVRCSRVLWLFVGCLSAVVVTADQRAVFKTAVDVVAVDAVVMRGRNPVVGLGPSDFLVLDNGVPQTIESVSQGNVPLDITLVLDFTSSATDDFPQFVQSAKSMQAMLRTEDRWRWLGIYMEARELLPMTAALGPLPSLLRPGSVSASAIHDAVFLALVRPGEPERRHLVIVFTDGNDTWSMLDERRLRAIADKADAVLHVVVSASPAAQSSQPGYGNERLNRRWRESHAALLDAAGASGGSFRHLTNRTEAFARIIEDFRSAYILRYTPKGVDTPGWHALNVSVTRPGAHTITARKGYERP